MRLLLRAISLLLFTLLVTACGRPERPQWALPISNQEARYFPGDSAQFAAADFDDRSWSTRKLNAAGDVPPPLSPEGFIWYRLHFSVAQPEHQQSLSIYLGLLGGADEAFLNGHRIGSTGSIGEQPRSAPRIVRHYRLPSSLLQPEDNVLALRVFNEVHQRTLEGPVALGPERLVERFARVQSNKWITADTALALLGAFSFLAWGASFLAGLRGEKSYFMGATFLAIALMFSLSHPLIESIDPGVAWRIALLSYLVSPSLYLLSLRAYWNAGPVRLVYAMAFSACLSAVLAVLAPLEWKDRATEIAGLFMLCPLAFWCAWAAQRWRSVSTDVERTIFVSVLLYTFCLLWAVIGNLSPLVTTSEAQLFPAQTALVLSVFALLSAGFIQLFRLRAELATAQTETIFAHQDARKRVAQDLHDGVVQELHAARISLHLAESLAGQERDRAVARVVGSLKSSTDALRLESHELHLGPLCGWAEFTAQLREWANHQDLEFDLGHFDSLDTLLAPGTSQQLQAIVREGWANAARHSECSLLTLECEELPGNIRVILSDNGKGFSATQNSPGIGLMSMRERSKRLGGTFRLDSGPQGTILTVEVPLDAEISE